MSFTLPVNIRLMGWINMNVPLVWWRSARAERGDMEWSMSNVFFFLNGKSMSNVNRPV